LVEAFNAVHNRHINVNENKVGNVVWFCSQFFEGFQSIIGKITEYGSLHPCHRQGKKLLVVHVVVNQKDTKRFSHRGIFLFKVKPNINRSGALREQN
jgi:hypothetical protein